MKDLHAASQKNAECAGLREGKVDKRFLLFRTRENETSKRRKAELSIWKITAASQLQLLAT